MRNIFKQYAKIASDQILCRSRPLEKVILYAASRICLLNWNCDEIQLLILIYYSLRVVSLEKVTATEYL